MTRKHLILAAAAAVTLAAPFAVNSALANEDAASQAGAAHAERIQTWPPAGRSATAEFGTESIPSGGASLEYVALASGCRLFDTRVTGGPIAASGFREFSVLDGPVASQGGPAGGCKVPADAVSVDMTLSTIAGSTTAVGFIRVGPAGATPTATALQFGAGEGTSSSTVVRLSSSQMRVAVFGGNANVVGDAVGYYRSPLHATVSAAATLIRGSGVSSIVKYNNLTGFYIVTFNRDISECTPVVSPETGYNTTRTTASLNGPAGEVFVYLNQVATTTTIDGAFNLVMSC